MSDAITRLSGALLGRYRIERKLGEGGMATVYLAKDERHDREVAVKVLRPELAAVVGAERFLAEIRTTAKLQHPHILPLHDSGEAEGFLFYVMPYVEGESLRDRLDREHQLPVDDAVRIGAAIAEGLDYAHRHGVIHRDIKPANILLVDGKPVLSDFGIALALGTAGAGRLTETGLSLGTPHYMSPEQATGDQQVGPSTDIYALGCVLYEMLVGEPPYTGSTPQAVLGKIITREAEPIRRHRKSVPANVDAAVAHALEKVPADRFPTASAFGVALGDSTFRHRAPSLASTSADASVWRRVSAVTGALAAGLAGVVAWPLMTSKGAANDARAVRFTIAAPATVGFPRLTPDGETLVFSMSGQLHRRDLDRLEITAIPGTEAPYEPFFSPDGEWLAFFDTEDEVVERVRLDGSDLQTIGPAPSSARSGGWSEDGTIVYNSTGLGGLHRIRASGGDPEPIETDVSEADGLLWLDLLPGGSAALGVQYPPGQFFPHEQIFAVPLDTGRRKFILDGMDPQYINSGHLMYWREGSLWIVPFDARNLEVTGPPALVAEDVRAGTNGSASYAATEDVLVYRRGGVGGVGFGRPYWVDRSGAREPLPVELGLYEVPRFSPDGTKVALSRLEDDENLWVYDETSGRATQVTFMPTDEWAPVWTPDGEWLIFASAGAGGDFGMYRVRSDGGGEPERLTTAEVTQVPQAVTLDGTSVIFAQGFLAAADVMVLSLASGAIEPLLNGGGEESFPALSADGRYLAYQSDQPGYVEVYVAEFPSLAGRRLVSTLDVGFFTNFANADPREGRYPLWSRDGRELFYRSGQAVVRVQMSPADGRPTGTPEVLFSGGLQPAGYDISPDGRRFVVIGSGATVEAADNEFVVVKNWFAEVRDRLAN